MTTPMLPLIIRLKHHIDSYLTTLNQQQPEAEELFTSLLQKLTALSDNITNSPFAEQQQISALSHIELLNGLIARVLIGSLGIKQPTHHAIALSDHLFEFVSHLNLDEPWKLLGQLWVNTSAIMAHSTDIPKLGNYISKLEQHESQLRSLDNSINIAHCLVYKSWGFAQQGDKQKLQQTLEQLRIRSDKRNSPQLTGAYCHAIKLSINYIAEQDLKLAQRLVKQMLELSHRYPIDDLYFACLWRTSVFEQQQNSFDTLLKLITKVHQSNIFNGELCLWLAHIHQNQQLEAIRNALSASQNLSVFSAALIKTACHSLISEPQSFIHRYNQWLQILTTDKEQDIKTEGIKEQRKVLQHTQKILTVLHQYHQQPQEQQLLQLPPLEQKLITQKLITQKLINKDLAINT